MRTYLRNLGHHGILAHGHCFTLPKLLQRFVHFYVRICSTAQSFRTAHKFNSGSCPGHLNHSVWHLSSANVAGRICLMRLPCFGWPDCYGRPTLTPCDRSLVGLFWTLFDILSVSYQQDGSGDLDLSSQSGSPFAWAWGILCLLGQWCLLCLSLC